MKNKIINSKIENILTRIEKDFTKARVLEPNQKKAIFHSIKCGLIENKNKLIKIVCKEVKLCKEDAEKEFNRAVKTFELAKNNYNYADIKTIKRGRIKILEKRIARGPLLAITSFSSPLSSPSHKIALGILVGTSILFKPSLYARKSGKALFKIITKATKGQYVRLLKCKNKRELRMVTSDDRIGIISFTGRYETGKKIIQSGGVKKYHMELSGGNSCVIFDWNFDKYDDNILNKIVLGVISKNGQRCVSIKHVFIPASRNEILLRLQSRLNKVYESVVNDLEKKSSPKIGPLINEKYAIMSEKKVNDILARFKNIKPYIQLKRKINYLLPCVFMVNNIEINTTRKLLDYDLSGPIVFIHIYKKDEYKNIIDALSNDYIRSGLQLSFFTNDANTAKKYYTNIIWGGIIVNNIPTFRDDFMSFGGFGKAGLGKEGFFETFQAYTDPQVIVVSK